MTRHLTALPVEAERPTVVGYPVTIELPTGGRFNADALLRELARHAFGPTLTGFRFDGADGRPRAWVTCRPLSTFDHDAISLGAKRVQAALVALGILKIAKHAEPPDGKAATVPAESSTATPEPPAEAPQTEACPPSSPES